jgi:hypothetical protein
MMAKFRPQDLPPINAPEFLELSDFEKGVLKRGAPDARQIEDLLQHPAFRYFMARIKRLARQAQSDFFSGAELPRGLANASTREGYFSALVNADRAVLDLQRQVWQEAMERDKDSPEPVTKVERHPEKDPFDPGDGELTRIQGALS